MNSPERRNDQAAVSPLATIRTGARRLLATLIERARTLIASPPRRSFTDRYQPGVFVISSPLLAQDLSSRAAAAGLIVARLNGQGVATKAEFLTAAARDLNFPDYFGHNWDAFADCLGDLAAGPSHGVMLILDDFEDFARATPREWQTALTILTRATEERRQATRPLYVFLLGPSDAATGVPTLDASNL